jgi:CubicO group peptidase (beta-lactamase class C family)
MEALMAKYAEPLVTRGQAVGIAVGIIDGSKSATAGFGRVKIGDRRVPDADTVFEIGSITKVFTASALSAMVRRGEVGLDEPVASLLPRSFKVPSYQGRQITLVDLATHTSGLPRVADDSTGLRDFIGFSMIRDPYASSTEADLRKFLAGYRLTSRPGKRCEYSNLGMGLLGYALSLKQRRSYEKMISDEVCRPLGLNDTSITLSGDQTKRLAQGYYGIEADGKDIVAFPASPWRFNDTNAGAGALRSTVNDLTRFVRANLGDAPADLDPTLQATHQVRHRIDNTMSVCLAWHTLSTPKHKEPIIWHNGGTGGYSSFIGFCKKHRTGEVLLCNVSPSNESTDAAAIKMLYGACKKSLH